MVLHKLDYLFAIGTIFAFLDAWNIGANDVANSWSTSVSSRSIGYLPAMCLASVLEFSGSIGVGARVADTIRTKVVNVNMYKDNPAMLMLGMTCAIVSSSLYLTLCTKVGLPVSTTHSIMGGVIGMGIATVGANNIIWWDSKGDITNGVVSVFLAWVLAPVVSGVFGAIIFTITKYLVMLRNNPVAKGLISVPIYFAATGMLLTMLIVWKGGSVNVERFTEGEMAGIIIGAGVAWGLIIAIFLLPWLYRLVAVNDWELRWYHIPLGPLLLKRPEPPVQPEGAEGGIKDFYEGHRTAEELEAERNAAAAAETADLEASGEKGNPEGKTRPAGSEADSDSHQAAAGATTMTNAVGRYSEYRHKPIVGPRPEGSLLSSAGMWWLFKRIFLNGVDQDIINLQKKKSMLTGDLEKIHAGVPHYDNKAEYLYSFLQIMTASTASFTHGANDVANAIGPYATIYNIWQSGSSAGSKSPVPDWILAFGGVAIVIGIWTYGYNIMKNLGNRLTLHSPSRGFSMELGAAISVIMATRLKFPVSTTQCITGATVGVGLCSGTWRTINWRMVAWIYFGWIITLPVAGIVAGCLAGIIINAPRWGYVINS